MIKSEIVKQLFKRLGLEETTIVQTSIILAGLCAKALCHPEKFTEEEIRELKEEGKQLFITRPL